MKLYLPDNIFTKLLYFSLPENYKSAVKFEPAIKIATLLEDDENAFGLITPIDLIKNEELFVSSKNGISFTGDISNSYLYFSSDKETLSEVLLAGDITTLEAMYAEIFFKEQYDIQITLNIIKERKIVNDENVLLIGDGNFKNDIYAKGTSFGSELIDMLEVPFVNFVFASKSKELIENINIDLQGIEKKIYQSVETKEYELPYTEQSNLLITDNLPSVIYELNNEDLEGMQQLIKLAFYYGKAEDIIDIKLV